MDANEVRERYERFARQEAPGRSDRYAEWAEGVAGDERIAGILAELSAPHRQPPLVFAVTRMLGAGLGGYAEWAEFFLANAERIVAECAQRTTQTNDPLRCAPLLVALSRVRGPIALLEVGASAGLCLLLDRYAYRFRDEDGSETALGDGSVEIVSELRGGLRAPRRLPDIVWRAGIDLHPRDPRDDADRAWISGLVWPGEAARQERVDGALDVARADPPLVVAGDASAGTALADLAAGAPRDATLVITTPGVLPHLPHAARTRLREEIAGLPARWITIDPPALHDAWDPPIDAESWDGFVLAMDGRAIAQTDPLGAWIRDA